MHDATCMLVALERGEACAEDLLVLVYDELRRLAAAKLSRELPGQTLQATELVHEAWLRLLGTCSAEAQWHSRRHFFGAAAEAMRRILIERARRKRTTRHGGSLQRVDLEALEIASPLPDDDLLALHDALDRLAVLDAPAAELIKLRFFAGLTQAQAAEALGMSKSTADRNWLFARAWLYREIHPQVQAKAVSAGKD